MVKRVWKFVKSKKIFIVLLILYTVVFVLAVRFIFHILPILLGGLLGWITAPLCRLLEKRLHLSHKRAALCTAVAVYTVSLVLLALLFTRLIRESAAFFASGRYFRTKHSPPPCGRFWSAHGRNCRSGSPLRRRIFRVTWVSPCPRCKAP